MLKNASNTYAAAKCVFSECPGSIVVSERSEAQFRNHGDTFWDLPCPACTWIQRIRRSALKPITDSGSANSRPFMCFF